MAGQHVPVLQAKKRVPSQAYRASECVVADCAALVPNPNLIPTKNGPYCIYCLQRALGLPIV